MHFYFLLQYKIRVTLLGSFGFVFLLSGRRDSIETVFYSVCRDRNRRKLWNRNKFVRVQIEFVFFLLVVPD